MMPQRSHEANTSQTAREMSDTSTAGFRLFIKLTGGFVTIALPFLLVMLNVRFIMSPVFLNLEYTRPGFPADFYGFTQQDRLRYAPYAVDYLLNDADISFLGDLTFPDGDALFNERELRHMRDVKVLTRAAYLAAYFGGAGMLLAGYVLARHVKLRTALTRGAIVTLGIVVSVVIVTVLNWNFFFTGFHALFFESGTWYFLYSDTLIRLFPEQFWFDAALVIGGITVLEALLVLLVTTRWRQGVKPHFDSARV